MMKQKKKNKFFTFIFSLLPGAAEMYMGFMKNGLSMMIIFFITFLPMAAFNSMEFMMLLSAVVWFYGFFHARNSAALRYSCRPHYAPFNHRKNPPLQ